MARLIDANVLKAAMWSIKPVPDSEYIFIDAIIGEIDNAPTVVEVADPELLGAIRLLIEQYEHSKNSDYVLSPAAHAMYKTWKKIDTRRK